MLVHGVDRQAVLQRALELKNSDEQGITAPALTTLQLEALRLRVLCRPCAHSLQWGLQCCV